MPRSTNVFARLALLGVLSLFFIIASDEGAEAKRVALIIGNAAYENAGALKNPRRDAEAIARQLTADGVEVVSGYDLDHKGMLRAVRDFSIRLKKADTAIFYYAGHGLQVYSQNYLVPIDAKLGTMTDLEFEAVSLDFITRRMNKRTNVIILDACRDNPLARNLSRSLQTRAASVGQGLAAIKAPGGTFIAYSTSPNSVAADGDSNNSPFAMSLLRHMQEPGLDINPLMRRVRADVIEATGGQQVPWDSSSLVRSFSFIKKPKAPAKQVAAAPAKAPVAAGRANSDQLSLLRDLKTSSKAVQAFETTRALDTCWAYKAYIKDFPGSYYTRLAQELIKRKCGKPAAVAQKPAPLPKPAATPQTPSAVEIETARLQPTKVEAAREFGAQPPLDGFALALRQQQALKKIGCYAGKIDGKWGRGSRLAMRRLNRQIQLDLPFETPDQQALAAIDQLENEICPRDAAPTHRKRLKTIKRARPKAKTVKRKKAPRKKLTRRTTSKPKPKARKTTKHRVKKKTATKKKVVKKKVAKKKVAKKKVVKRAPKKTTAKKPKSNFSCRKDVWGTKANPIFAGC